MNNTTIIWLLTVLLSIVVGTPIVTDSQSPNSRIIGGIEASPHEFPFLVSLQWTGGHFCSGVIISETVVLTSAFCVQFANDPYKILVTAGRYKLNNETEVSISQQSIEGLTVTSHRDYIGGNGLANDLAVIKLLRALQFNEAVGSIALPVSGQVVSGTGIITGWGSGKEEEISLKDTLLKAELPILSDEQCKLQYVEEFDENSMICAGNLESGGIDFCNGDAGGPLIAKNDDGSIYLAGISSWGDGCGKAGFPGIYTEIAHFLDFIQLNS